MTLFSVILLGALQGLTEFLPISSDGHLVLAALYLDLPLSGKDALGFDVLLHGGSLLALLLLYGEQWKSLLLSPLRGDKPSQRLLILLILATIPAALAGWFFEDAIALHTRTLLAAALGLLCTGIVLVLGEAVGERRTTVARSTREVRWHHALLIGCAQVIAILPGVSRSGLTVSGARMLGIERKAALDFSFLMAVPIIAGAVGKILLEALHGQVVLPSLLHASTGFVTSFLVSVLAIGFLRTWVSRRSLGWFSIYLIPLSLLLLEDALGIRAFLSVQNVPALLAQYGAIALFLLAFMETVPPLSFVSPGVIALIVGGSLIPGPHTGLLFFAAACAGVMLGNLFLYALGEKYGRSIAHRLHLTEEHMERADQFMRRYGRASVFVGQFFAIVRPAIAFVAGTTRFPHHSYYLWMVCSAMCWAALYLSLGYFLRAHLPWLVGAVGIAGTALFVCGAAVVGLHRWLHQRANGAPSRSA